MSIRSKAIALVLTRREVTDISARGIANQPGRGTTITQRLPRLASQQLSQAA